MYECHITFSSDDKFGEIEHIVNHIGWNYSRIDGDPTLGKGVKQYATKHFNKNRTEQEVIEEMKATAIKLELCDFKILRQKVEFILYDTKTK